ncbi:hypothetical protein MAPG_09396 [Magnaporthiopsis poae ATCC 64411]|uniref:Mitochondrial transcription factor 1 n=1 Tax=Magnaporthiopsis poae (strain ATCC 64411 / 73-15) TaxID=644358 RepID=A0A0C4E9U6_MAGP6|nr:hypothetical protein MAPG_09396 [Magnaporthiopsis poae ATCC 64411]
MLPAARHVRTAASFSTGLRLPLRCLRWTSTTSDSHDNDTGLESSLDEDGQASGKDKKENIYIPGTKLAEKLVATGIYDKRRRAFASEAERKAKWAMTRDERRAERQRKAAEKEAGTAPKKIDKRTKAYRILKGTSEPDGVTGVDKRTKATRVKADSARVNIVSEKLCSDVIDYMAPSLERHKGCDIIDLYPGVGLFSTALSDFLQPRSHILMEPDHLAYTPFLQPLLDRPGTVLVPESGVVWSKLSRILTPEFLPHQVPRQPGAPPERNDTLLVIANINFSPKKKLGQFASLGNLLLYQFIQSIAPGSLFQKYGLVRMLLWCGIEEKRTLLPPKSEFFPNVPASLLDIQPKVMHPRLREMGPNSSHAAEEFELVMSMLLRVGASQPVGDAMRTIWHGAAGGVMPNCPSLHDPDRAGSGLAGLGSKNDDVCTRVLNENQWMELLEAWMKWEFRPSYEQLIGASESSGDAEED